MFGSHVKISVQLARDKYNIFCCKLYDCEAEMLHDVVEHILLFFRLLIIGFIKKNSFKLVIKLVYTLFVYMVLYL